MHMSRVNFADFRQAAILGVVGALAGATAAPPVFNNLGSIPSGSPSEGVAISGDGLTVVGQSGSSSRVAYRWRSSSGMQSIGMFPGAIASYGGGVNDNGTAITGFCDFTGYARAFRWTSGGGMQPLALHPGGTGSEAFGFSADGQIVIGSCGSEPNGLFRATRWFANGTIENLGALPGAVYSEGRATSDDGSVVIGTSGVAAGARAFRWTAAGGMQDLGLLPGATQSFAGAISADGSVIAGSCTVPGGSRVFRWTSAGGMQDLGVLQGFTTSGASSMNAAGTIIVGAAGPFGSTQRAFFWTESLGIVDLQEYLVSVGTFLGDVSINSARGISDDGTRITGSATQGGLRQAYIVTGMPRFLPCPHDLNRSGFIDLGDLAILLADFGAPDAEPEDGDLDDDGDIDLHDLTSFLARFGEAC